jgi:hypothetical protein
VVARPGLLGTPGLVLLSPPEPPAVCRQPPVEEQASRKERLLKGPEEFRNVRVNRAKTKDQ